MTSEQDSNFGAKDNSSNCEQSKCFRVATPAGLRDRTYQCTRQKISHRQCCYQKSAFHFHMSPIQSDLLNPSAKKFGKVLEE